MDGPLPFLFGMAPERAKARYEFKLIAENETAYAIEVTPKWKQDAIDWIKAKLILDREMCLPLEVYLYNPAGTTETVYKFSSLQVNKIRFFFWTNPFQPSLTFEGYKRSVHNNPVAGGPQGPLGEGAAPIDPIAANRMPSLIGGPWKPVKEKLESLGHPVKLQSRRSGKRSRPGISHRTPGSTAECAARQKLGDHPDPLREDANEPAADGQQTERSVRSEKPPRLVSDGHPA